MADLINKIEAKAGYGYNRTTLTLNLEDSPCTFVFRTGGELVSPITHTADISGAFNGSGLFDPWTLSGTISIDAGVLKYMYDAWYDKNLAYRTTGLVTIYTSGSGGVTVKFLFNNARIAKLPTFSPPEIGGETLLPAEFTLNQLTGAPEVLCHKGTRPV